MEKMLYLYSIVSIIVLAHSVDGFNTNIPVISKQRQNTLQTSTSHSALTERQVQFWEDVEKGLDEIEQYFAKKGYDIDRIRQFEKSAKGEIPPPQGVSPWHQPSEEHVEGLTAKPYWDSMNESELFPWARELEANAQVIQSEYQAKLQESNQFASDSVWQNQVMGTGWSAVRLQRLGVWNTENCQQFPETYNLLKSLKIPMAVRGVCFARQAAGTGVQPHSDGRNFILTSHLGLKIPSGCWIDVGNEKRNWEEGKLLTLDTSFQHSTYNPTDQDRHVLIIDFWHPELTEAEKAALEFIYDLRNQFESGAVPFRKPKSTVENDVGIGRWWQSLMGMGR